LYARQERIRLPDGVFLIDRPQRPPEGGWYEVEYDPADQFVAAVRKPKPVEAEP
jgi:hypothetical protein